MSKKHFYHIGFYKTGSTFFQKNIFPRLNHLFYIGGYDLMYNFNFNKLLYEDDYYYNADEIKNEMKDIKNPILLSSEWIVGDQKFYGINRSIVADRLYEINPNAEIILFIRSQPELMLSFYNQTIKAKRSFLKIQDFYPIKPEPSKSLSLKMINKSNNRKTSFVKNHYFHPMQQEVSPNFFNHYDLIKLYKSKFEHVHVFLYEDFRDNPKKITARLLKILESELNVEYFESSFDSKENRSLENKNQEIQRIFNKLSIVSGNKIYRKVANYIAKFTAKDLYKENKKFIFEYCNKYYKENNNKLNEEFPEIGLNKYKEGYLID